MHSTYISSKVEHTIKPFCFAWFITHAFWVGLFLFCIWYFMSNPISLVYLWTVVFPEITVKLSRRLMSEKDRHSNEQIKRQGLFTVIVNYSLYLLLSSILHILEQLSKIPWNLREFLINFFLSVHHPAFTYVTGLVLLAYCMLCF